MVNIAADLIKRLKKVEAERDALKAALVVARDYVYHQTQNILRDSDMKQIADDYAFIETAIAKCEVGNG